MSTFILFAAILLMLGKADIRLIQTASDQIADGGLPILSILARPISLVKDLATEAGHVLAVHEENARLRRENQRLLVWKARAVRLEVQNRFLSDIVKLPIKDVATRSVSARVVADSSPVFAQSRLLDIGLANGVGPGMAVVDADGLIGRLSHASKESSRLLLLTDYASRVPVVVGSTGEQAIMEGDSTPLPILKFLPLNPLFELGDEVITSGAGGILPAGIPVGVLVSVPGSPIHENVRVKPYVDWSRLNIVSVVKGNAVEPPADIVAQNSP